MPMVGGKERRSSHPQPVAIAHSLSIERTRTDPHPLLLLPGLWNLDFSPCLLWLLCLWCWDEEGRLQDCTCARQGFIPHLTFALCLNVCDVYTSLCVSAQVGCPAHVWGCLCTCVGAPVHMSRNTFRGPGRHHSPLYSLKQGLSNPELMIWLVLLAGMLQGSLSEPSEGWTSKQASTPSHHACRCYWPTLQSSCLLSKCCIPWVIWASSPGWFLASISSRSFSMCAHVWVNGWVHVEARQLLLHFSF